MAATSLRMSSNSVCFSVVDMILSANELHLDESLVVWFQSSLDSAEESMHIMAISWISGIYSLHHQFLRSVFFLEFGLQIAMSLLYFSLET